MIITCSELYSESVCQDRQSEDLAVELALQIEISTVHVILSLKVASGVTIIGISKDAHVNDDALIGVPEAIYALGKVMTYVCGNGLAEGDEQCESTDLNGHTCETEG